MRRNLRPPCTLLALLLAAPSWPQSEPLGRLFLTPEARAALERRRLLEDKETPARLTLDGQVRRSSGRHTIWINGRPLTEKDSLPAGWDRLQVGETLHLDTGERSDLLPGGRLAVSRHVPARP